MAQLLKSSITGSTTDTGSLLITGSQPITLPHLQSGSGEVYLGNGISDLGKTNQFWFDSGDNYVKYNVNGSYQAGTWTTGPDTIVARKTVAGAGTANAGLAIGGDNPPSSFFSCTEHFSGITWSAGGALIQARSGIGTVGTENAALASGGCNTPVSQKLTCTEEYDGSSWSAGGALSTGRYGLVGAGTQNSAAMFGGYNVPTIVACTEEYNGTSYATGGAMIQARTMLSSGGTQNAALATSGVCSGVRNNAEKYNGTSWSATAALNNGRYNQGRGSLGSQNSSIVFAGVVSSPAAVACTEQFDGTTWTNVGAMVQANRGSAGFGDQSEAVSSHGIADTTDTQIWTRPFVRPFSCYMPGAWSAGGHLITARIKLSGNSTSISAGIVAGGCNQTGTMYSCTEEYNGSSWSAGGAMITARGLLSAFGTQDAQVAAGGSTNMPTNTSDATEEYNGSSWTAVTAMPSGLRETARAGTSAHAGMVWTGQPNKTFEYDGTNWSAGGTLITARYTPGGWGEVNAAVSVGGEGSGLTTCVEHYDGSSWSTATAYPLITCGAQGTGTQNAGLSFGGSTFPSPSNEALPNVYLYDGLTWTADASLSCGRSSAAGNGTQNEAFAAGGVGPATLNVTEEYCRPFICTSASCNIVTPASWSAGGAMIIARRLMGGAGTQNAAFIAGGYDGNRITSVEEYNGSSWSAGGVLAQCRAGLAGAGTQNAGLAFGGEYPGQPNLACTEEYDGSSWSGGGNMITGRQGLAGYGLQNAALAFAGWNAPTDRACTEEYNGSAWSAGGALISAGSAMGGFGTQNAGTRVGGTTGTRVTTVSEYNGSTWSAATALPAANESMGSAGIQNAGLVFGGEPVDTVTLSYDGTSWSAENSLITGRDGMPQNCMGTQDAALAAGGRTPSLVACTEEYSGASTPSFYNFRSCLRCLEGTTTSL